MKDRRASTIHHRAPIAILDECIRRHGLKGAPVQAHAQLPAIPTTAIGPVFKAVAMAEHDSQAPILGDGNGRAGEERCVRVIVFRPLPIFPPRSTNCVINPRSLVADGSLRRKTAIAAIEIVSEYLHWPGGSDALTQNDDLIRGFLRDDNLGRCLHPRELEQQHHEDNAPSTSQSSKTILIFPQPPACHGTRLGFTALFANLV